MARMNFGNEFIDDKKLEGPSWKCEEWFDFKRFKWILYHMFTFFCYLVCTLGDSGDF